MTSPEFRPLDCSCEPDGRSWNSPHIVVLVDDGDAMVLAILAAHPPYMAAKADIQRYADVAEGLEAVHVEVIPFATPAQVKTDIDDILGAV